MSFKIPCGGFKLDENSFSLDENGVLSIPKPLTYDYMPEGYPKKDGWSVEWDGNIEGKTSAVGAPLYKFSDMVLSYDEFLSANYVVYLGGEQHSGMVSEVNPMQNQFSDTVSIFDSDFMSFFVVSEDNAEGQGVIFPTKGLYTVEETESPFKLIKETITPMSNDFIPKNFNVVFSGINSATPDSCNVTYDELRGWIENGIPVIATYKYKQNDSSVSSVKNIINFEIDTDSLRVYYGSGTNFKYNSDGTFSGGGVES